MIIIEGENINQIQLDLYRNLSDKGKEVDVRGSSTIELFPVLIKFNKPLNRLTTIKERKWNLPFAIGEVAWHLSGSKDFDFISYYSKNWKVALEEGEGEIKQSCYGHQIFSNDNEVWNGVITELLNDQYSRRAVVSLLDSKKSLGRVVKDVACTSTIQFLVRDDKLDCIVNMRSNDIVWGLPNDIFFVTILQEWLAIILNVGLGVYYHNVGSLHIYERHYGLMKKILNDPQYIALEMPQMEKIQGIQQFLNYENLIRTQGLTNHGVSGYWGDLLDVLLLRSKKVSNINKRQIIETSNYKKVLELCPEKYIFGQKNGRVYN